mgnify:CR=1 FL=1
MSTNAYESPFSSRYASEEMQYVFSQDNKFKTWRKLWIALAKAEKALGINITDEQIAELEANKDNINYEVAREREKLVRHDVMSHVYAYGCQCPNAKGIITWRTSCYVATTPTSSSCARAWRLSAASCSTSSPCWQNLPTSTRTCPALPTPTCSGPADHRRQARHFVD